jgi:hypothetical protein
MDLLRKNGASTNADDASAYVAANASANDNFPEDVVKSCDTFLYNCIMYLDLKDSVRVQQTKIDSIDIAMNNIDDKLIYFGSGLGPRRQHYRNRDQKN